VHHQGVSAIETAGGPGGLRAPLVALTGNPNSGKTSLFNHLTGSSQKVANYAGVTVDLREGILRHNGALYRILDLPGLYSLSAVSPDEEIARDLIVHGVGAAGRPDLIVQVLDGGRLERSLLLTMQLIEQELPVVIAFNMFDEVMRRGLLIDLKRLSSRLGIPVAATVGNKGEGIEGLKTAIHASTERALDDIQSACRDEGSPVVRGVAIGLLTQEPSAGRGLPASAVERSKTIARTAKPAIGESWTDAVTHARFAAISELLADSSGVSQSRADSRTARLDYVFIHRFWGIPIFLVILFLLFQATFTLGAYPMEWIDVGVGRLQEVVKNYMFGLAGEVIADGFIAGAGMVLIFLPNILILLMGIHLLEDSGYMARAAFLMDRIMRLMGLHGRAFIPLLMGFGCNVPAMMGSRVLESRRDRILMLLLTPFMSCSARLPVYVMITAAFFPRNAGLVIFSLYLLGALAAVIFGRLFSRTILRGQSSPFMLELPPYRWPTLKTTVNLLRFTSVEFLRRIGGIVAACAVVVWFLTNFPRADAGVSIHSSSLVEDSCSSTQFSLQDEPKTKVYAGGAYIYRIGRFLEPLFKPLGFTLEMDVALVSGFVAKEAVAATMGVLYAGDPEAGKETLVEQLRRQIPGTASAMAFLVFVLLYTPCLATVVTLLRESRRWYWMAFSIAYQTSFAWLMALLAFRLMGG